MTSQPRPIQILSVYNPDSFVTTNQQESYAVNDARYIRLTTNQTVAGTKNFTTAPQINGASIKTVQSGTSSYGFTIGFGTIGGPTSVTFPSAFSSTPNVTATVVGTTANGCSRLVVTIQSVSSTDFSYNIANLAGSGTASSISVSWVASS